MRRLSVVSAVVLTITSLGCARAARAPTLRFHVFAHTGLRLTGMVWTGRQFLYVVNTTNRVMVAGPAGMPWRPFASMPRQVEETRCIPSPGAHGFPAGVIYCHSPDNKIYRISANGKAVNVFAVLPHSPRSDSALVFDSAGKFGYRLLAATGRSGSATGRGGTVFTVDPAGHMRRVGAYTNPGGADEIAVAPANFGSAAGQALLTVDAGHHGSLVAMGPGGHARTLVRLSDGPNPIVVITRDTFPAAGAARSGLYVTDTGSHDVYFAPASQVRSLEGAVVIGTELRGYFWAVRRSGSGFVAHRLSTNLTAPSYNLEQATYLAG